MSLAEQQIQPVSQDSQSTVLSPVSWQTYEGLLNDLGESYVTRLIYDQGRLEIMPPPLPPHERYSSLFHGIVMILSEELNLNIYSLRTTTLRRPDLQRGLEPDNAYYIQHEALARNQDKFDFTQFPPPDLVIEVDITHSSIKKLPIYQSLGVPEIWRYDGKTMTIYQLSTERYLICEGSATFAQLPLQVIIPQLMARCSIVGEMPVLREFRQWVKEQGQE